MSDKDKEKKEFAKMIRRHEEMKKMGMKSAVSGYSDVSEAMHIMGDEINRSADLNIAAMLPLSKVFDAVFKAFMLEVDAHSLDNDVCRKFMMECGIVDAGDGGCVHCAPGSIHLHDLQVIAGFAAVRFFLFSRLRKIGSALPLVNQMMEDGNLDAAHQSLSEATQSAAMMVKIMDKLGFQLRSDHPVATLISEGMFKAGELMHVINQGIKDRDAAK